MGHLKPYETYQYLEGTPMTERDKLEIDSKFWNEGKWKNFILPFLPEDCGELTLIDMGCNAGLFLSMAEEKGFGQVIGVDSNEEAVKRGLVWRDTDKGAYQIRHGDESCDLPMADYTILANVHYYIPIEKWLAYLDKLQYKTRYCIIVTTDRHIRQRCWPKADLESIRRYFRGWEEVGFIDELPLEGNHARRLWGLCFKSSIERVPIDSLDCGNHVQDRFYAELDAGKDFKRTRYYRILKPYRKDWSEEKLDNWVMALMALYEDVKVNRLTSPLIVEGNLILDGNHRHAMMKHLGHKSILVRKI